MSCFCAPAIPLAASWPVWPRQPVTAHWGIPDPATLEGDENEVDAAFARTHVMLSNRINLFMALPFEELDQMAIQNHVRQIGEHEDQQA